MSRRIIKYANRRLYDPLQGRAITLLGLSDLLAGGETVTVEDKESGEDITAVTVLQSILERVKRRPGEGLDDGGTQRLLDLVRAAIENRASRGEAFEPGVGKVSAALTE